MADGQRVGIQLGHGERHHPLCNLKCRGSERHRMDSPARFGRTPDGRKVVWCPCCNTQLRDAKPGETGISVGTHVQFASLSPDVAAKARIVVDDICDYEVIVFREMLPVGHKDATAPEPE